VCGVIQCHVVPIGSQGPIADSVADSGQSADHREARFVEPHQEHHVMYI
jgi:hypothetical protein